MAARCASCRSTSIRQALQAKGLSAQDVENAIAAQNQILPAGTVKIGATQYTVKLNDAAETIDGAQRPAGQVP